MSRCIITGCTLVDAANGRWVGGDLHEEGDCYIFNAIVHRDNVLWSYEGTPFYMKKITVYAPSPFERRGVLVFRKCHAQLNSEAQAYVDEAP